MYTFYKKININQNDSNVLYDLMNRLNDMDPLSNINLLNRYYKSNSKSTQTENPSHILFNDDVKDWIKQDVVESPSYSNNNTANIIMNYLKQKMDLLILQLEHLLDKFLEKTGFV